MPITIDTSRTDNLLRAAQSDFAQLRDSEFIDLALIMNEGGVLCYLTVRDSSNEIHLSAVMEMNFDCNWEYCRVGNVPARTQFNSNVAELIVAANSWAGCRVNARAA
jgi:hypothetical protein